MDHGPVCHTVTEGEVECLEANTALGQVAHTDVRHVVARPQVEAPQATHLGQRLHPGVGDVGAEAEVEAVHSEAGGDVSEGEVADLLTVLEDQLVQVSRLRAELLDAGVCHLPARPEVQSPQLAQPPGHQLEAEVGYPGAAAQSESLEVGRLAGDNLDTFVRHLLAEAEVEAGQGGQGGV